MVVKHTKMGYCNGTERMHEEMALDLPNAGKMRRIFESFGCTNLSMASRGIFRLLY